MGETPKTALAPQDRAALPLRLCVLEKRGVARQKIIYARGLFIQTRYTKQFSIKNPKLVLKEVEESKIQNDLALPTLSKAGFPQFSPKT
ncbi:hypothetical protein FACHB389_09485 [Nostoc calcicola FACHB-389]|nr:hypothetical protein FACHB389_09485 [Nostoc calcicola FACHB-389]